ncbi:MAG: transpeptidase family protein [Deltaproteobacteria bacterium]|nr:transpeptidase family protein [Deltaproteobacteria bacterium]
MAKGFSIRGWRFKAVALGAGLLFAALLWRAFELQVIDGGKLSKRAATQQLATLDIPLKRGGIYDRNGAELAVSMDVTSVYARPGEVENASSAAKSLSKVLTVEKSELKKGLSSDKGFVWLKRQIDLSGDAAEFVDSVDGVGIVKEGRRFYPNGRLLANVIGFSGVDMKGLEGIESAYNKRLSGIPRKVRTAKDATGRALLYEDIETGVQGSDLVLTIDKNIQYIAEKALASTVSDYNAKGGSVIVMEPFSGEILAMANLPTFDPNEFKSYSSAAWRNGAVADTFEPGSTMKVFLMAGAMEEGAVKPADRFFCENGSYKVRDRVFHDSKKHGWLTAAEVIKNSSNIGAIKMANKLGKNRYYGYLTAFGFGDKTGIDINGEQGGNIGELKNWSDVKFSTASFGHGISTSPLQLVTAVSAIANGGYLMKPHLVKSVKGIDGAVSEDFYPTVLRRVISESTAATTTKIMQSVTAEGGTGVLANFAEEFPVAGKTGTAQKPDHKNGGYMKDKYVVSFLGFVPANDPKIAIIVVVDEPKKGDIYGGTIAAPAFSDIARETLSYMGVTPKAAKPRVDMAKTDKPFKVVNAAYTAEGGSLVSYVAPSKGVVPDFTGLTLRAALKVARESSIEIKVSGTGKAVTQSHVPGAVVKDGDKVAVSFK